MKSRSMDLVEGPLFSGILRYTIPIVLSGVLQLLFNAADLMVVGQFCGSISVGAVSSTGAITNLIVNLFAGLSVGAGVSVAHAVGSRSLEKIHRTVHTAIPVAFFSGLFLTVVGVLFSKPLLELMGTPADVLPLAATYMTIYFAGIVFTLLYNFGAAILQASGDTKSALIYLTGAGILNVILNLIFVILFHMNVAGVALATILSQALSAILVIRQLMRRRDSCRFVLRDSHIYWEPLKKMVRIGLPAGIQGCMFSISNVMIQSSVNSFGSSTFIAGNGASSNIEGFVYTSMNAVSQATVNFIGQNLGAQRFDRIRKTLRTCFGIVTFLGIALGGLAYIYGERLLSFYITDSPEAIAAGHLRMFYICLPYFVCGLMDVCTGALRGLGKSLLPMLVSILGVCGFRILWICTVFQMPRFHTPGVLYSSYIISWIITFTVQFLLFEISIRRLEKQHRDLAAA